ncbi:hypothetical protein D9M68_205180 [compost metagenome]
MDFCTRNATPRLLALAMFTSSLLVAAPAHSQDGIIVLQRTLQPRIATHPTDRPDPHPTVVNANTSRQVVSTINGSLGSTGVNGELGDADFAGVTSGSGIRSMIMPGGNLVGLGAGQPAHNTNPQNITGEAIGHSGGGGVGGGIANTVNSTVQRGLSPLQMLGGGK